MASDARLRPRQRPADLRCSRSTWEPSPAPALTAWVGDSDRLRCRSACRRSGGSGGRRWRSCSSYAAPPAARRLRRADPRRDRHPRHAVPDHRRRRHPLPGSSLRGTVPGVRHSGVGRIGAVAAPQVGGWLLGAGFGVGSNFLTFAAAAGLAAVLLLVTDLSIRGRRGPSAPSPPNSSTDPLKRSRHVGQPSKIRRPPRRRGHLDRPTPTPELVSRV